MKKNPVFLALLVLLLSASAMQAQKRIGGFISGHRFFHSVVLQVKPASPLEGRWIRTYQDHAPDRLVFTPHKKDELRWGNYLEFLPEGQVAKGYSAPCGNDTNIHRHHGTYKVELQTILIDLGPNGTLSYRIMERNADRLVLQALN